MPFDAISLDFTRMCNINEPSVMQLSSNGLASGMTENEAILSAIYEIIERHSTTTWDLKPTINNRIVDLNSIKNQDIKKCICKFINKKLSLTIKDLTIFDEFPTYSAYLYDQYGNGNIGWGCSSNSEIAFLRALIESHQARTIQISGAREDMFKFDYLLRKKIIEIEPKNNTKPNAIDFENNKKDLKIQDYKELKSIFRKYNISDPLCFTFKNNLDMFAVRVVIPNLHGYLYPGYESMIRKEFFEELNDYQSKTRHYPAAI